MFWRHWNRVGLVVLSSFIVQPTARRIFSRLMLLKRHCASASSTHATMVKVARASAYTARRRGPEACLPFAKPEQAQRVPLPPTALRGNSVLADGRTWDL